VEGPRARRRARWRATGRAEEGHGRAQWSPHEEEEGGAGVTEGAVGPRARWRGLGRGGGHGGGPRVARRRGTGARSGGRTRKKRAAPVSRKANGRGGGGARKKRAAVFDEEEDERIDLRQALEVIYQRELLPVPATNRE